MLSARRVRVSYTARFAIFHLLFYGSGGIFIPYLGLYLERHGLTGTQLGFLLGLLPLIGTLAQPVWSMLSDVYQIRRGVLTIACLGAAISVLSFRVVHAFGGFLIVGVLYAIMRAPILPLGNALTLDYLEREGREEDFGPLRSWGSVGFGVTSLLGATFFIKTLIDVLPIIYAGLMVGLTLIGLTLPKGGAQQPARWVEGTRLLPERPRLTLFIAGAVLVIAPMMTAIQYLTIFMENSGTPGWITGLAVSAMAFYEVPMMLQTPRIMERASLSRLILGGVLLAPVRWIVFSLIQASWLIIPAQLLHSITVVSLMVIGITYVDRQLPPRWRATGQGLYTAAVFGIGPSIWQFVAGPVYENFGVRAVWLASLGITVVGVLILGLALRKTDTSAQ